MALLRVFTLVSFLTLSSLSWAQRGDTSGREFIMSCTYGVLAGTLVGAATLAFEDQPGDNLNKVARGASIGLYAGILLGAYVVYGVSDGSEEYEQYIEQGLPPVEGETTQRLQPNNRPASSVLLGLAPVFDPDRNIAGASAQLTWSMF